MAAHTRPKTRRHIRRHRIPRWTIALPVSLVLTVGGAQAWASSATTSDVTSTEAAAASSGAASTTTATTTTASATASAEGGAAKDGATTSTPGTSTSTNTANGVTARFTITDTGSSITIDGTATGLKAGSSYVSLIYPANNCSNAVPASDRTTAGETQAATWENHGEGSATLTARYTGVAYRAVRGRIGSESVREITAIAPADGTDFSATYAAIDCVPITPRR